MFVLLTPIVAAGLLLLTGNRALMKDHASGLWSKFAISLALIISAWLSYENAVELIGDLV
jgi:Mn2+/Fe2+ NRAMP family transporter